MKAENLPTIKKELQTYDREDLLELCLKMIRFKKENKELLTYLLFEASYEPGYIETVKIDVDEQFDQITTKNFYYIKKSVRKILRAVKKYIRYSKNKETEITLLHYFCEKLRDLEPDIRKNRMLTKLYNRERASILKKIEKLHEDLQLDYYNLMEDLTEL